MKCHLIQKISVQNTEVSFKGNIVGLRRCQLEKCIIVTACTIQIKENKMFLLSKFLAIHQVQAVQIRFYLKV
jgi:hypothetical protein